MSKITHYSDMIAKDQWVVANEKKQPLTVRGYNAKVNDRSTWDTYENCTKALSVAKPYVGYVLTLEDNILALDFDGALEENGEPTVWAKEWYDLFVGKTLMYHTPSGMGFRILVQGTKPDYLPKSVKVHSEPLKVCGKEKAQEIELFDGASARYIIVCEDDFIDGVETINECNEECRLLFLWMRSLSVPKDKKEKEIPPILPDTDLKEVHRCLSALSSERCDDYNEWLSVGCCLKGISTSLLGVWIDWSKQSSKFEAGVCENKWQQLPHGSAQEELRSLQNKAIADTRETSVTISNNKISYKDAFERLGFSFRYNELTEKVENNGVPLDDMTFSDIHITMKEICGYQNERLLEHYIKYFAGKDRYHPIKEYLKRVETLDRSICASVYDTFLEYIDFKDKEIARSIFTKWLLGCVHRILGKNYQSFCMVLEGLPGIGKTSLCKWITPKPEWYCEDTPNPDDKDHCLRLASVWIWELGELESITSKQEAGKVKNFTTKQYTSERPPFAKYSIQREAIASFVATVNLGVYLMDTTGNRRFFPIYINSIDLSYETLDKDYIWGYIMHLYLEGVSPILSPEEKAYQTRKNEEKRTQSTIEVILSDILQPKESGFVSSVQLVEALKEKGERVSNTRAIASVMQLLGYPSDVKKVNGKATRGYRGCTLEAIQPEYFEH